MHIEYRQLGRSSVKLTSLGLGCASFAGYLKYTSMRDAEAIVEYAYQRGVRYFDTAPFYGSGRSEHITGDGLRDRTGWVLSTKVARVLRPRSPGTQGRSIFKGAFPFEEIFDYSYDGIVRSIEDSLQRLGLDHVDIIYIQALDEVAHRDPGTLERYFATAMSEGYRVLQTLKASGVIKAIGLGVNRCSAILRAMEHGNWDCALLAGRYTLLEHEEAVAELLPRMVAAGMSLIIGGPFNSGVLVGGTTWDYVPVPDHVAAKVAALSRVCDSHGIPLGAAALQFPLAHPAVASAIPGPSSVEELAQILSWLELDIPDELWADLKNEKLINHSVPVPARDQSA